MRVDLESGEQRIAATDAAASICTLASGAGSPAWIIAQSFTEIRFQVWDTFPLPFDTIFAGRIFGKEGEVRWVREADQVTLWCLREVPGVRYRRCEAPYYLWGRYRASESRFAEDLVRDLKPYPHTSPPVNDDRPYIEVYEYVPEPPAQALDREELMAQLNQPRVAAHRFVTFDCGKD